MEKRWHAACVPAPELCVVRPLLEKHAATQPDKVFARFPDGSEWTYAQTLENVRRTAAGLQALGVRQGENVHSWLPNGPDAIRVWFALNYIGAVFVPLNVAYRGGILEHAIRLSGARLMIAHAALVDRLAQIDCQSLTDLVVLGSADVRVPGLAVHPSSVLEPATYESAPLEREISPWDPQSIIYTSGTTGPSKGVMSSYAHVHSGSSSWPFGGPEDRRLVNLPMFHMGGTGPVYASLMQGASVAIVDSFQTDTFWDVGDANGATPLGTCGKPRAGVEVRIVDENDCEVAAGETGELMVRTDRPWAMNSGYYGNPEATARAWRNGWFHTGDAFRMDAQGNFYFVDRIKDAIRRRGENISSFEVEAEVGSHPSVQECAAVAVPGALGEDEVLVAIAPQPGQEIDHKALIEYLIPRMAHFMIPRYIRIVLELPKTPTQKVQKHLIRSEGITADTWDREKAGIVIRRQKI